PALIRCFIAVSPSSPLFCFFFFNATATTEIYTLSYTTLFRSDRVAAPRRRPRPLVPGAARLARPGARRGGRGLPRVVPASPSARDRKSTRLNSSHDQISYAVFCLKKKNKK